MWGFPQEPATLAAGPSGLVVFGLAGPSRGWRDLAFEENTEGGPLVHGSLPEGMFGRAGRMRGQSEKRGTGRVQTRTTHTAQ